tara:strand:+ start:243 stop:389 length:147 start_codon:yes stop_codon:yes gene_type:complete
VEADNLYLELGEQVVVEVEQQQQVEMHLILLYLVENQEMVVQEHPIQF